MLKWVEVSVLAMAGVATTAPAQHPALPTFAMYQVTGTFSGSKAPVHLQRGSAPWRYRTMIRDGYANTPVNFAGHYVIVSWGCGTECRTFAVIDARTGRATVLPVSVMSGASYRIESTLFVAEPPEAARQFFRSALPSDTSLYASAYSYFYRWQDGQLHLIDSVKVDTTQVSAP